MMNRPYVYFDFGFYAPCNLKCTYCRSKLVRDDGTVSLNTVQRMLDVFCERNRAAVAKTSGYGEITMWRHFASLMDLMADRFAAVQVITNGTFRQEIVDAILKRPTISPNFTIDGHTLAMNQLRVAGRQALHRRILANLKSLTEGGRRVEVNCVLHEHNIEPLASFCDYLAENYGDRVMLFPFPARSFSLAPSVGSAVAARLIDHIDVLGRLSNTHSIVLPPAPYMEELVTFIQRGGRHSPCHVHWLNAGCGPGHDRLFCANYGEDLAYGPLASSTVALERIIASQERIHLAAGRVGPGCDDCFNHFHILGMYLEGRLSVDDLVQVPSLSFDGIRDILIETKEVFSAAARHRCNAAVGLSNE